MESKAMESAPVEESVLALASANVDTGEQSREGIWPHPYLDPKQITEERVSLAPTTIQTDADAMDVDQTEEVTKQHTTTDASPEGQDTEAHIQPPSTVLRIAVRSVLWDDILVEVPSNATMLEFRKAIETQSKGKLREDVLPELVYDGILLPADATSVKEAGLAVENAVVGFLALDVYSLTTSAGLEPAEVAREKKPRDRRIKIYVPCAPRVQIDAPTLENMTQQPAQLDAVSKPLIASEAQTIGPQSSPAGPPSKQAPQKASVETTKASAQTSQPSDPYNVATEDKRSKSALPKTPQPIEGGTSEGTTDSSTQIEPGELPYPLLVLAALPSHLLKYSMGVGPQATAEGSEPPKILVPAQGTQLAVEVQPPEGSAPQSVTREGSLDAELMHPAEGGAEAMEIQPPESVAPVNETIGGGSDDAGMTGPAQGTLAVQDSAERGAERVEMEAPGTIPCATTLSPEVAPSEHAALVPYTSPPPVVYGPGGREMVPVDTSRKRKSRATEETEEERQVRLRRARRLFSVGEVEALVTAVERLGPGRWREVKERVFSLADHRTYGDLKDKWKTLVKTAQIAPQQRRGVEIPEELLERVTRAHAYWTAQAAKDERLADLDTEPHMHYMRPLLLQNGAPSEHHADQSQPSAHDQAHRFEGYGNQGTQVQQGNPAQTLHHGAALSGAHAEEARQDGRVEEGAHDEYAGQPSAYAAGHSQQWQQHLQANYQEQQPHNQDYQQQNAYENQPPANEHYQSGEDAAPNPQPGQYASYQSEGYKEGGQDENRDERGYHQEQAEEGYVAHQEAAVADFLMGDQTEHRQSAEGQQGPRQGSDQAPAGVPEVGQRHEHLANAV